MTDRLLAAISQSDLDNLLAAAHVCGSSALAAAGAAGRYVLLRSLKLIGNDVRQRRSCCFAQTSINSGTG
jgi:hypothetical protein